MTYGEFKDRVLQLIFSYSIAGDEIELSYNNQEDYVKQIPALLSTAQSYVYQIKTFEDCVKLKDLMHEEFDDYTMLYHLPDDCLAMIPGLIVPRRSGYGRPVERNTDYKLFGGDKLLVSKHVPDEAILEYEKRGVPVPANVPDTYLLKNTDEVNEILPFYVAAFLVLYDDAFRYAALYNEFETRLQRLRTNPTYVETTEVFDAYGGFKGADWGYYGGYW